MNFLFHEIGETQSGFCEHPNKYQLSVVEYQYIIQKLIQWDVDSISFDDGGSSNLEAVEIARKLGFIGKIFIFLPTKYIGEKGFLSKSQVLYLSKLDNVCIGSHTHNHPKFYHELTRQQRLFEWGYSKNYLEDLISRKVVTGSIPGGCIYEYELAEGYEEMFTSYIKKCVSTGFRNRFSVDKDRVSFMRKMPDLNVLLQNYRCKYWDSKFLIQRILRKVQNL